MANNRLTVKELAEDAGVGVEDALLTLWDEGFDAVEKPEDVVPKRVAGRARRVLGIPSRRELGSKEHWYRILGIDREAFEALLLELGVRVPSGNARLSKKAISRLKAETRTRGLEPIREKQKREKAIQERENQKNRRTSADLDRQPFKWEEVGSRLEQMGLLSPEELCAIHEALVSDFVKANDPIDPPGLRSEHLLASAIHRQATSIGGTAKYPTVEMAGAALLHSLVHNHPFHNGNKRTGLVALIVFLDRNGFKLTCDEDDLFRFVLQVAKHGLLKDNGVPDRDDREVLAISKWLRANSRRIEQGNRPVQWRKLKQILANFGCEIKHANVGNKVNITRKVPLGERGLFRREKRTTLQTQVAYTDDGRDADRGVLQKIRQDGPLRRLLWRDSGP